VNAAMAQHVTSFRMELVGFITQNRTLILLINLKTNTLLIIPYLISIKDKEFNTIFLKDNKQKQQKKIMALIWI